MPYLGNPAQQRFSSPRAASVYSGDGSTTAFTLEEVVTTDEDILVSVDGVIQEPSVAYAVSSGTTLTFTAAPSSNSGNNIFVYYIARTFGSISMPDGQNVNAATGSFSGAFAAAGGAVFNEASASVDFRVESNGNANMLVVDGSADKVGIGVAAPSTTLHLDSGGTPTTIQIDSDTESSINFNDHGGSAQAFKIGTNISGNTGNLEIYDVTDSALVMSVDGTGAITKPLQPAFLAMPNAVQDNVAEGADVLIVFGSERFDNNSDFASNTFTAPVTGRYFLSYSLFVQAVDNAPTYFETYLVTSNKTYNHTIDPRGFDADPFYWTFNQAIVADMDAGDTAQIKINIHNGGTVQTDINNHSYFSGYLVA